MITVLNGHVYCHMFGQTRCLDFDLNCHMLLNSNLRPSYVFENKKEKAFISEEQGNRAPLGGPQIMP